MTTQDSARYSRLVELFARSRPSLTGTAAATSSAGSLAKVAALVELLRRLARAANTPVDRLELARGTTDATGRAVDVQVTRLRRKIEDDPKNPRYLQTVRGVGYRLAPD